MSRQQYWKRAGVNEYDGALKKTEVQLVKTGITETSSRSIENELKITIAADASFSYGAASVVAEDGDSKHAQSVREYESVKDP